MGGEEWFPRHVLFLHAAFPIEASGCPGCNYISPNINSVQFGLSLPAVGNGKI